MLSLGQLPLSRVEQIAARVTRRRVYPLRKVGRQSLACVGLLLLATVLLSGNVACDGLQPSDADAQATQLADGAGASPSAAKPAESPSDALRAGAQDTGVSGIGGLSSDTVAGQEQSRSDVVEITEPLIGAPTITAPLQTNGMSGEGGATGSAEADRKQIIANRANFQDRLFARIQPVQTDEPDKLEEYLTLVDSGIKDLLVSAGNGLIGEQATNAFGRELGQMKLDAAERLIKQAEASADQQQVGRMAKLVALSHLAGFGDAAAARNLEAYAGDLTNDPDVALAHQARVVQLGFELQALQNGVSTDPTALVQGAAALFEGGAERGFPELMMLRQSIGVLQQMGFVDAAAEVKDILVSQYSDASDPKFRAEAWSIAVAGSPALDNYLTALQKLNTTQFDPAAAFAASRGLYDAFPSIQTLEQLASTIVNIEYSGHVDLAMQLAEFIEMRIDGQATGAGSDTGSAAPADAVSKSGKAAVSAAIESVLAKHRARVGLIGQPFPTEGLTDFSGQALNWDAFAGKVVLVDFWATWCQPCLQELPTIEKVHAAAADRGFAVLSVNMDENLDGAEAFLQRRNFPWKAYRSGNEQRLGFQAEFAKEMGIVAIPFMLLVGPDGKVVDIHVRGEMLMPRVNALLGTPDSLIRDDYELPPGE